MTEQQRLEELSKLKNVSLLSKFIDEATEVICKCDTCQNQFEKFPEVLFEQELWCEQCQQDPTNIVEKMLIESGCNIKEKKFKNMYAHLEKKNEFMFIEKLINFYASFGKLRLFMHFLVRNLLNEKGGYIGNA